MKCKAIVDLHQTRSPATRNRTLLWRTGTPRREFLFVDDLAEALVYCLQHLNCGDVPGNFVNVGVGEDVTIRDLAALIGRIVGYRGEVIWDASMPDGTPRKLLDVGRLHAMGWKESRTLQQGIAETYAWFVGQQK
jgi:GDP-L-fucose synthase